ncbi:uncharacterized protein KQ657_003242 [Scheffersomyces spartinae]|uniref:Uncharacterized protein n=1 Tax=Scheffersomyces spartinae TaxID=45513 RepID=A0A9P7VCR6_9ASCO|nr:uncharacterized protein KQ657_003242 [Scheffersomyces spartinae]KAG7195479.1 hypothetical protein KQ657_003242 [Scheffersomyces spartinae]
MSSTDIQSKEHTNADSEIHPPEIHRVSEAGNGGEFVVLGNKHYYKHELMKAFGGNLNPGLATPPKHQFANPAPLGLSAFAFTTFVLSMYNAGAMGVKPPNVVLGAAAFYGGFIQMLAGIWELAVGNTFGGTALTSYGAFWLSYVAILVPAFGIEAAYEGTDQMGNAVAFYLLAWSLFTFMLTIVTMKSTLFFFSLFFCLAVTFLLLSIADFTGNSNVKTAGGVMGVITAFLGWYNAWAGTANKANSYITSWPIPLSKQ